MCFVLTSTGFDASVSMKGKSYVSLNGKALCDPCAAKEAGGAAGACAGCGVAFDRSKDTITQAMGKSYHPGSYDTS